MLPASVSSPNPLSKTTTDNPMRFYGDIVAARPISAFMPSAPDRTVVRCGDGLSAVQFPLAQLC